MPGRSPSQRLIDFFDPEVKGKDPRGRTLDDIIAWPDQELEYSHDYIQNLFPLPEGSMFNSAIWLVDADVYNTFRGRDELQVSFNRAFIRICSFYGLNIRYHTSDDIHGQQTVLPGANYGSAKRNWVSRFNHNHLRITRIIRSLRVLGLTQQSKALHDFLSTSDEVARITSDKSRMFWQRAAERPLHLPPDEEDENATGIAWLQDRG